MDPVAVANAVIGGQAARMQIAAAAKLMRINTQSADCVVQLLQAASQNLHRLANVAPGVGTTLDVSA